MSGLARKRAGTALVAATAGGLATYLLRVRPWHLHWGATDEEMVRPMAGDELVPQPTYVTNRAVTVWARPGSARTALLAAERLGLLVHEAALPLAGHRLVSLRVTALEAGRDAESGLATATLRLAALTEPMDSGATP